MANASHAALGWFADTRCMTSVHGFCAECGDIEVPVNALAVEAPGGGHSGSYVFSCPACASVVARAAGPRLAEVLVAFGAQAVGEQAAPARSVDTTAAQRPPLRRVARHARTRGPSHSLGRWDSSSTIRSTKCSPRTSPSAWSRGVVPRRARSSPRAARVIDGDDASWYTEWRATADALVDSARASANAGHRVGAPRDVPAGRRLLRIRAATPVRYSRRPPPDRGICASAVRVRERGRAARSTRRTVQCRARRCDDAGLVLPGRRRPRAAHRRDQRVRHGHARDVPRLRRVSGAPRLPLRGL